jgi:hypothetical protein
MLQSSQHFFSQALQQRSDLFIHNLSQVPNQLYMDCKALFLLVAGPPAAIAVIVPEAKNTKKTRITTLLTIAPPFFSIDYITKNTGRQLKRLSSTASCDILIAEGF